MRCTVIDPFGVQAAVRCDALEVAVLDRTRPRRAFKRLSADRLTTILGAPST